MAHLKEETAAYHALAHLREGSARAITLLCREYGGFAAAYNALQERGIALPDRTAASQELDARGIELVLRNDPRFPSLLLEAPDAPLALYAKGTLPPDHALAIVGTRRATAYGEKTAHQFAATLGRAGAAIVSGLAYGIDAAAHEGALSVGAPTVAVLPCGLDLVYPRAHAKLAERILAAGGALVSEYPPGVEPFSFRFLERNRIVSGLARGVIIIEAPEKSGALVTARLALEQNRDVFVVPGKPNEPQYRGSHALLRDGARIVARPEDVLEDLGIAPGTADRADAALDGTEADVLALLKENGPLSIDKLVERSNLGPHEITQALALLALKGLVIESGANYYAA